MTHLGSGGRLPDPNFFRGKRVLLTGHTGFKGAWAALWLARMGADVTGFALAPDTDPNLFNLAHVADDVHSIIGDLRDPKAVNDAITRSKPELVVHMGAQALVRRSYSEPVATFASNVMGTVHLLDGLRHVPTLQAALIVTTDKVYENPEAGRPFRESDPLGGHDPYSASKAATEIATQSYARSFFGPAGVSIATARGGNVIGGGDFSPDRIVPDIWRACERGEPVTLRYPDATRPWQHVLDCLSGYFLYLEALANREPVPPALNFGPPLEGALPVRALAEAMQRHLGVSQAWRQEDRPMPKEMLTLALSTEAARKSLNWQDRLKGETVFHWTADWYRHYRAGADVKMVMANQLETYLKSS